MHQDLHPAPGHSAKPVLRVRRDSQRQGHAITGSQDWTRYEVAAQVPAGAEQVEFDLTLAGPGQIGLRNVELTRIS
jgi:hypothetical protein